MSNQFQTRYNQLNEKQRQAVDTLDGPMLVIAGPGSGKTELLSLRVANILLKTDANPHNILCLTFTEAAATNMRQRLVSLIGQEAYRVAIHTFHNFCTEIINRHPEHFYNGAEFNPADEVIQIEILETIFNGLSHDNPLRSIHPEEGYIYVRPVKNAIGSLKKAGLSPEEFTEVLQDNKKSLEEISEKIDEIFSKTMGNKLVPEIKAFIEDLDLKDTSSFPLTHLQPYYKSLAFSLRKALLLSEELGKAGPLSEWKKNRTRKNTQGKRILQDQKYQPLLVALADIYDTYQKNLYEQCYFDFDDMLLSVIQTLQSNQELQYELQEHYQYLLVDEFQDTNDAQMRILNLISDAIVNEGRPNLMVVGDDDQAIFKFQGAEISNILHFQQFVANPVTITLTHNYRSTQNILDIARKIILRGQERLENLLPEVKKELIAANTKLKKGSIINRAFPTQTHEYHWIAQKIAQLIKDGHEASEIAIIARNHRELEAIVPYLHQEGIDVRYERQQNVLKEPHIQELIQISRFLCSLGRNNTKQADDLLPEILNYPFWGIQKDVIWKISTTAYREKKNWLECMLEYKDPSIQALATFFIELGGRSYNEPLESILESLLGAHIPLAPDSEIEDGEDKESEPTGFISPFKDYYFSNKHLQENTSTYLRFLSSLKVFVSSLSEYHRGQLVKLEDMLVFVEMHEKNKISLNDTSPFVSGPNAIHLMSAHGAKGLEYETVFVLSCQEDVWGSNGRGSKLLFPLNLPIAPAGETEDDHLRLFFVALTRAKRNLYLTSYDLNNKGKEALRSQFLSEEEVIRTTDELLDSIKLLEQDRIIKHIQPLVKDEKILLQPLLENYKLNVTHLNNFLDVTKGGPQAFLESNLLRFPQPLTASAQYGSAIHAVLNRIHLEIKKGSPPLSDDKIKKIVTGCLQNQRLHVADYERLLEKGLYELPLYYRQKIHTFKADDESEYDFSRQDATIDTAAISGKIDKIIRVDSNTMHVCDYKTGKPALSWQGKTPYEKIKLWKYRRQLTFYKLLIENSRDFSHKYTVKTGSIEFIEPLEDQLLHLELTISDEEVEHLKKVIMAVYTKIMNLDFPDTSHYSADLKGIEAFEEDLLEGVV